MSTQTYRMIGTTDDVIDCDRCGKHDLRMTVILVWLTADGEDGDTVHYGSSCAAKALSEGGTRRTAAQVRDEARFAQTARERDAAEAAQWLSEMDLPLDAEPSPEQFTAALARYAYANRIAFANNPGLSAAEALAESIQRRQAAIAA